MDEIFEWMKKHPVLSFIIIVGGLIFLGIVMIKLVQVVYYMQNSIKLPETGFLVTDILSFWGNYLSFIGTVGSGALALWQNKRLHDENVKSEKVSMSKSLPILNIEKFSAKIYNGCHSVTENQVALNFKNKEKAKYDLYLKTFDTNDENQKKWISIDLEVIYRGEARCNKIKINNVKLFYGNSYERKELIHTYTLHEMANRIGRLFLDNDSVNMSLNICTKKEFEDIEKNSIFIEMDIEFFDIVGICYKCEWAYSFGSNKPSLDEGCILLDERYKVTNTLYPK